MSRGRPRLPKAKAEISGSIIKNAGRFESRSKPVARPLGDPYATMTDHQRAAWEDFRADLPWLNASHRQLVRVACVLVARIENSPDVGLNQLQTLSAVLSKLAATPVDESRVTAPDESEEDPTDHFFTTSAH